MEVIMSVIHLDPNRKKRRRQAGTVLAAQAADYRGALEEMLAADRPAPRKGRAAGTVTRLHRSESGDSAA
jgi:hypothetical protein